MTDARKKRIIRGTKLLTVDRNNRPHLLTSLGSTRVAGFLFGWARFFVGMGTAEARSGDPTQAGGVPLCIALCVYKVRCLKERQTVLIDFVEVVRCCRF